MYPNLLSLLAPGQWLRYLLGAALAFGSAGIARAQAPAQATSIIGLGTATQVIQPNSTLFFPPGAAIGDQGLVFFFTAANSQGGANPTGFPVKITGVIPGQKLVGIDSRPLNGLVYGLGYDDSKTVANAQLYTVNTATGAVSPVGTPISLLLGPLGPLGQNVGFDFNPVTDLIQVVSSNRANYSLNPNTGSVVLKGGDLTYSAGTPIPGVTTAAYTNSTIGSTSTTLFDVDKLNGSILTIQAPPDAGTLTRTQPRLMLGTDDLSSSLAYGLDIANNATTGLLVQVEFPRSTLSDGSPNTTNLSATNLFDVDLQSGVVSNKRTLIPAGSSSGFNVFDLAVPITPPVCDAPTGPSATNVTGNSATVNFTGSSSATSYTVTTSPATTTQTLPAGATSVSFTNLTPNTTYTVSIASNCYNGLLTSGPVTKSFTTMAPAPCNAPTALTPANVTSNSATVNFTGSSTATGYTVTTSPTTTTQTLPANATSVDFTGLMPSTAYTVSIVSNCAGGATSAPATTTFTTMATPNPVPTISSLSPASVTAGAAAQTLTVNGTGFVSGQSQVSFNGTTRLTTFLSATQLTIDLTAADQATPGSFSVIVTNPAPGGGTSAPATFVVNPAPVCNAPTAPTPANVTNTSATVNFTGSSSATSYSVTTSPATPAQTLPANATSVSFAGLTPGTAYTVSIVSNCAGGATSAPATTTFTTTSACDAPTALTPANVTSNSATVNFTGSATATSYTVTTSPVTTTQTLPAGASSVNFTGLTPSTTYTVTIASNCAGGLTAAATTTFPTSAAPCTAPTAALSSPSPSRVCAGTPVTVNATLTGTAPFTVTVSATTVSGTTSQTNTVPTNTISLTQPLAQTTTFAITALTDANGCTANPSTLPSITFTVDPLPTFTTTKTDVACFGGSTGSITVTASGGTGSFEYSKDGGTTYQASNVFGGLAANTYSVRVRNLGGTQCAAAAQPVVISQPASAVAVTATKTDATSFGASDGTVTATGNGGTSPYQYSLDNGATYQPATPSAGSYTFTGLTANNYTVTVRDANACTATTTVTVGSPGACNAPTNLSAANPMPTSVNVTFTAGAGNTSFTATATPQGGGTAVTGTGTGSPIALTGLAPNTTYTLSLQAVCAGGGTTPAVTTTFNTPATACTAPGTPSFTSITTTSASVSFTPSSSNVGPYTVTATGGGATVTATGSGSPIALTGLAAGTTYSVTVTGTCTATAGGGTSPASAPATLTTATPACDAPTAPVVSNVTSNSATVNFTASATAVSYTVTTSPATTSQTVTGTTATLSGLTPSTSYTVSIVSNCAGGQTSAAVTSASFTTAPAPLTDLVVSSPQVIQGSYRNVTVTGTGQATLGGTLTVNGAMVVQAGGVLIQNCQLLNGPGSFELQAGASLAICDPAGITTTGTVGAIQVAGTRSFSPDASYAYNGTVAQVTGSGLPARVLNLGVSNTSGVTLSQAVSVTQVVRLQMGNLNTGGQMLTLLSSASSTALVDNRGGVVTGTATVQRYIDPSRNGGPGYRHYSAPVTNTTVSDLTTAGFTPVVNPNYNTLGNTVRPFPNVFDYDETRVTTSGNPAPQDFDKGFRSPTSTSDPLEVTRGYTVNISAAALVDFVGTLNNGALTAGGLTRGSQAESGYHLRGNPYPSPLDWNLMRANGRLTNVEDALYVFKSSGQYTGSYASYINGVGANGGTNVLPLAQGFFVRTVAGQVGTLTFTNAERLTSPDNTPFQRSTADARPQLTLALSTATARIQAAVYFEQGATAGFDKSFDAHALPSANGLTLASEAATAEALAINGLPVLTGADVLVPLRVSGASAGTYTLAVDKLANLPGAYHAYLRDALTGTYTDLATTPSVSLTLAANAAAGGRYAVLFTPQSRVLATAPAALARLASVYPNPAHGTATLLLPLALRGNQATAVTVVDNLGRTVLTRTLAAGAAETLELPLANLASGVYSVLAHTASGLVAKRLVVQ